MKINKKIIIINILLIIIVFFILDIFVYYRQLYFSHRYDPAIDNVSYFSHIFRNMNKKYIENVMFDNTLYKEPANKDINSNSIILFGCSFVEGASLKKNETFQYLMGKISHLPVYDRSYGGWGPQHMLYQTENNKFYSIIKTPPDIVIYTFIFDHLNREYNAMEPVLYGGYPTFVYKKSNDKLVFDNIALFFFRFPFLAYLRQVYNDYFHPQSEQEDLLIQHIIQSKNNIENYYKRNIKFLVLIYTDDDNCIELPEKLKNNNISTVTFKELTGLYYRDKNLIISENDTHPNAKAWSYIVPKLWENINNYSIPEKTDNNKSSIKNEQKKYTKTPIIFVLKSIDGRKFPSNFSICASDNNLISEDKITKEQALFAYIFWSISNLIHCKFTKPLSKIFINIAIKINPYNDIYEKYYYNYYIKN